MSVFIKNKRETSYTPPHFGITLGPKGTDTAISNITSEVKSLTASQMVDLKKDARRHLMEIFKTDNEPFDITKISHSVVIKASRNQPLVKNSIDHVDRRAQSSEQNLSKDIGGVKKSADALKTANRSLDRHTHLAERALSQSIYSAIWTIGDEIGDMIPVSIQLCGHRGGKTRSISKNLYSVAWRLLDNIDGTLTTVAPDGGIIAKVGGNGKIWANNGDLNGELCCTNIGQVDLELTHVAGAKTVFFALSMNDGSIKISPAIAWA